MFLNLKLNGLESRFHNQHYLSTPGTQFDTTNTMITWLKITSVSRSTTSVNWITFIILLGLLRIIFKSIDWVASHYHSRNAFWTRNRRTKQTVTDRIGMFSEWSGPWILDTDNLWSLLNIKLMVVQILHVNIYNL